MTRADDEIARLKTEISLSEYASSLGYRVDPQKSSRNSVVMRRDDGDKIVIAKRGACWTYFSVKESSDRGTILDFVQRRTGRNLGETRRLLRPWIGENAELHRARQRGASYVADVEPTEKDIAGVQARFAAFTARPSAYLVKRAIPRELQRHARFAGTIYTDRRGNAIFPHTDSDGVCGYEVKNDDFTGFAKGGEKTLWASKAYAGDNCAVVAETALDALSYAALQGVEGTRFFSIGGGMNPRQPELLRRAASRLPDSARVILAMDADASGDALCDGVIGALGEEIGRVSVVNGQPSERGIDWNDVLRASVRADHPGS